jgi:hypothetical protein
MNASSYRRHKRPEYEDALDRLLENYRSSNYRTTSTGRRVQWDEPGEEDGPEVRRHNAYLTQARLRRANARERLKRKGIVPSKKGQPLFEKEYQNNGYSISNASLMGRGHQPLKQIHFKDFAAKARAIRDSMI